MEQEAEQVRILAKLETIEKRLDALCPPDEQGAPSRFCPSDEHFLQHNYVKLLMEKEQQRLAFRQAVIEKSALVVLGILITSFITWVTTQLSSYFKH